MVPCPSGSRIVRRVTGVAISSDSIIAHYHGVIDGLLVDQRDETPRGDVAIASADTLMLTLADRTRVAAAALALADSLRS